EMLPMEAFLIIHILNPGMRNILYKKKGISEKCRIKSTMLQFLNILNMQQRRTFDEILVKKKDVVGKIDKREA
ncbi:MAG: hypothetical protein ACOX89_10415, partial [Lutispora sp.]